MALNREANIGVALSNQQSALLHEAGHVVGALLAGHRIEAVQIGLTKRNPTNAGTTVLDLAASPDIDYYGHLIAVLLGPMAEGEPPPRWPPLPRVERNHDEHVAATLVSHLKLAKRDYLAAIALAEHWLADPLVRIAIARLAHALAGAGALTDRMVRDVLGPQLVAWFELGPRPEGVELCSS